MSRIVELAQAIERELEDNRHMIMELNAQLDEEKKCRRNLIHALEDVLEQFKGEE
jgi:nitrate reductase assembly molybdenum cofactor insertion protein NarJ